MQFITERSFKKYIEEDHLDAYLDTAEAPIEKELSCQQWLRSFPEKRHIADIIYSQFLRSQGLSILDVGSGLTTLQRVISERHQLTIIEKFAHDKPEQVEMFMKSCPRLKVKSCDWFEDDCNDTYDYVIANDLFPNVDQRLDLFIQKYSVRSKKILISATFYNDTRFYETCRVNADEHLFYLAWNGEVLDNLLKKHKDSMVGYEQNALQGFHDSIFQNNRQVAVIEFEGSIR